METKNPHDSHQTGLSCGFWRRWRDSNSRARFQTYSRSRGMLNPLFIRDCTTLSGSRVGVSYNLISVIQTMCPKKAARRRSLHHANLYATSLDTGTPSALARLSITSEVGFAVPHSTALTVRTHTPEAKASRSCDHPNSNLLILTFTPIVVDNMTRSLSAGRRD